MMDTRTLVQEGPRAADEVSVMAASARSGTIDLLKAIASQLIVLHHLAFYGPMTDHARELAPALLEWLEAYGRIGVQVFLVIGGFLAAKALAPSRVPAVHDPFHLIARRFTKLVPPYLVAVGLAIAASALAGAWMTHGSISAAPTLEQLAAHALLLHTILGYESLSAGVWYVAIDFQLFALLTLLLWAAGRPAQNSPARPTRLSRWLAPTLITLPMAASLLYFNRDPAWDAWALYFFGSYGLGVLAWWVSDTRRPGVAVTLVGAMLLPTLAALALDFRIRIAVALLTALIMVALFRGGIRLSGKRSGLLGYLGRISYSVFLVHFPVCLIVNAAFTRFAPSVAVVQACGVVIAWLFSTAAGAAFHRWVEQPLGRLGGRARWRGAMDRISC
jgi:peptidoglycan/LPS O-acetylase OafA/YrhL